LWHVATGKEVRRGTGHQHAILTVAFASDGRRLATGSQDGTLRLWDAATGRALHCSENGTSSETLKKDPESIPFWEREAKPVRAHFLAGGPSTLSLAVSREGRTVAAASASRTGWIALWDVSAGKDLSRIQLSPTGPIEVNGLALSPDGKAVAGGLAALRSQSF